MTNNDTRKDEGLKSLGRTTEYRTDYAPDVLETFVNKHQDNDYWVRFNCPEFTSLCPITGQPDFAEIRISYVPDVKMVESKSLKLYLFSFRNQADGSQVHRGYGAVHSARRHQHSSLRQLRTARHEV